MSNRIDDALEQEEIGYGEVTSSDPEASRNTGADIRRIIQEKLTEAVNKKIITPLQAKEMYDLLLKYLPTFGLKQKVIQMSSLAPMSVKLKPNVRPFKASYRLMTKIHMEAMRRKLDDLTQMGMLERSCHPYFSSPAFMVAKKNGSFRMVVDLRKVNENVEETATNLPNLENQLSWLPAGTNWYGGHDALSGFDMLRTNPTHTKYFGISTPFGVYKLLGNPMEFLSTPGIYMDRMITYLLGRAEKGSIFGSSPSGCLQWLDDTLIYAPTFHEYLSVLEKVLKNCVIWKLRLNIAKCNLVAKEIEWCGRELHKENGTTKLLTSIKC